MGGNILAALVGAIGGGTIRVVDLSQSLHPATPVIQLPPEFGESWPFRIQKISEYDSRGPAWYWNNISCGEHTGTHFDAPIHWVTGKDYPTGATDKIPPQKFVAPVCVIDTSAESASDPDFLLTVEHVKAWEEKHGKIEAGSWVLMRTDWCKRTSPEAFLNAKEDGAHSPGPHPDLVLFLIKERNVIGWGSETVGTDAGQAFRFDPPFPCHNGMHGNNRFGLASLANLDQLPPKGAVLMAAPLKISNGSGSPCRVLALVPVSE